MARSRIKKGHECCAMTLLRLSYQSPRSHKRRFSRSPPRQPARHVKSTRYDSRNSFLKQILDSSPHGRVSRTLKRLQPNSSPHASDIAPAYQTLTTERSTSMTFTTIHPALTRQRTATPSERPRSRRRLRETTSPIHK